MSSPSLSACPAWVRRQAAEYCGQPPDWWGPVWNRGTRRTLADLVTDATIDTESAARLGSLVERGESVTVAAPAGGAGKTTVLTALLGAIPPERPRRYVRGIHDDVARDPAVRLQTALLVNEISPHLPIYCWGASLRSVLERAADGDQLLATIHAETARDAAAILAAAPLSLPENLIAGLGWIAVLGPDRRLQAVVHVTSEFL